MAFKNKLHLQLVKVSPKLMEKSDSDRPNPKVSFGQNLRAYISCYCNTATIHGVKYVGENGRYLIEKFVWLCTVATVFTLCMLLIRKTYIKWKSSPVIVSLETRETPIYKIPFPAVTICPEANINPDYFNLTHYVFNKLIGINGTEKEEQIFDASLLICTSAQMYGEHFGLTFNKEFIDEDIFEELYSNTPTVYIEGLTTIQFLGKKVEDELSVSITEEGLCYTFNSLPISEILKDVEQTEFVKNKTKSSQNVRKWSLEDGYPPGDDLDSYPRRTFLSGFEGGLLVDGLYTNNSQLDYLCQESLQGFKIALHHPSELPNMDKHFRLPLNKALFVAIKPTMITVSEELLNYDFKERLCYFSKEKYLNFYKVYTQQNCLQECLANFTLQNCGCVTFWMPRLEDTKICGPGKRQCIQMSKINYLKNEKGDEVEAPKCECLPLCTSLSYDIETSQTNWKWFEFFKLYNMLNQSDSLDLNASHFSKLMVYYRDLQFLTSKRHELYGFVEFFANIGGLLGLFVGFSVISAIEIIHFLTLRVACNIRKYGKVCWSGDPKLLKPFK